jgi:hypothetical protein
MISPSFAILNAYRIENGRIFDLYGRKHNEPKITNADSDMLCAFEDCLKRLPEIKEIEFIHDSYRTVTITNVDEKATDKEIEEFLLKVKVLPNSGPRSFIKEWKRTQPNIVELNFLSSKLALEFM